jgi:hypothetical protein
VIGDRNTACYYEKSQEHFGFYSRYQSFEGLLRGNL